MDPRSVDDPHLLAALEPYEEVHVYARATDAALAVSDRRVLVAAAERLALSVPFHNLRRVQFDIERRRPATLVLVPERAKDEPQVLAIPPEEYRTVAEALVAIGLRLYELAEGQDAAPEKDSAKGA